MVYSASELLELSRRECLVLLTAAQVGRLAITHRALPAIVPVRLHLVDGGIVLSSLLGGAFPVEPGTVAALETGTLGDGSPRGWTVGVRGYLEAANPGPLELDSSIVPGSSLLRLSTEFLSGWRLHDERVAGRGVLSGEGPGRAQLLSPQ